MILSVLFLNLVIPQNSFSEEICFEVPVAKKMIAEINHSREVQHQLETLRLVFGKEQSLFKSLIQDAKNNNELLLEQIDDEHLRAESYRTEWKNCGKSLTKCQQSKPSKQVWFSAGFGSALIVALLVIAL